MRAWLLNAADADVDLPGDGALDGVIAPGIAYGVKVFFDRIFSKFLPIRLRGGPTGHVAQALVEIPFQFHLEIWRMDFFKWKIDRSILIPN